ncbi:hypothetical protein SePPVgORF033 [Seal parapoxvirus]|uniref:Protein OPG091 n=1 Tax=Seal parapoxvirus TaxID=187984 RepID=A0A1Z3GCV6_9POXV|nr:hypothetical protein CGV03_gp033 [Seal parapoxvirus]ASC55596.1 hypothetical protein SePPVgORF033 [Seal parapoxvirus]
MDTFESRMARAIVNTCPRGSLIFVTSAMSMTECLNPSEYKHAAIYVGSLNVNSRSVMRSVALGSSSNYCANVPCVIDASAPHGARITPLVDLLRHCLVVKAYQLAVPGALMLMNLAADAAFELVGTPYGFNTGRTYCFKLVADCFASVGVSTRTRKIMGREVVLSQDFVEQEGVWTKIFDSSELGASALR